MSMYSLCNVFPPAKIMFSGTVALGFRLRVRTQRTSRSMGLYFRKFDGTHHLFAGMLVGRKSTNFT